MSVAAANAVWIDDAYDHSHASNRTSRYGAYIAQHLDTFAECWDGTFDSDLSSHFTAAAWRVAIGPIMAPGYVRYHPRILHTELAHSYWDGSLLARVDLIAPWPHPLQRSTQWMQPTGRGWWHDWCNEFGDAYCEPSDEDLAKSPYLLTTASLRFSLPTADLPLLPASWRAQAMPDIAEVVTVAQAAVAVTVKEINQAVGPVLEALEHG